jgi:hypothetical protein
VGRREKWLYFSYTLAVQGLAGGHLDPAFADAVFLDIRTLLVVEADANVVLEHGGDMVRAARIDRQVVGQCGALGGVVHTYLLGRSAQQTQQVIARQGTGHDQQCGLGGARADQGSGDAADENRAKNVGGFHGGQW